MSEGKRDRRSMLIREMEMALIGWVISQPSQAHVVSQVTGADFADPKRGIAFHEATRLADETGDVAPTAMRKALVANDVCPFEAAVAWIRDAVEVAPKSPTAAASIVEEFKFESLTRRLKVVGGLISGAGENPDAPQTHDGLLDFVEAAFGDGLKNEQTLRAWTMAELLDDDMRLMKDNAPGVLTGLPFGFSGLDAMTCGAQAGDMIILAGRPSMGKSALAGQFASIWVAGDEDAILAGAPFQAIPGALFTLEMQGVSYVQRMICSRGRVSLLDRRRNSLRDSQYRSYMRQHEVLRTSPLRLVDRPTLKLTEFRSACRRLKAELDIKFIVVDYLQLMSGNRKRGDSREQEVSSISSGIKAVARELGVPAIVVCQLNRGNEQRSDRRPQMSDLRESGSLEQDADVVMLIHREEYYHVNNPEWASENPDKVGVAELIVAKQRNGPVGVVKLRWDGAYARFYEQDSDSTQGRFA